MELRSILSLPWLFTILLTALTLTALQWFQEDLLFERSLINEGEWWRIITGNFVHNNSPHLYMNLLGLALLGLLFNAYFPIRCFIISTIILSLLVGLGLYFYAPRLEMYVGFSGALYGLYLLGAVTALKHKDMITGIGIFIIIIGKLVWDIFDPSLNQNSADLIEISIATESHWLGAIGGLIIGLFYFFTMKND
ncbi:MAG: Rhombosortase [uncultured Thiotrichaceae bacterium]|uniref:Rhombosortase n=1 Tax=uncultured Thiotrichaceae bacterium TaxID=298394 RepID=A0A6S6SYP7_9GAMM|nr:MAG: Rhombosortase [uncultured Thiotrichaceae bacterium]